MKQLAFFTIFLHIITTIVTMNWNRWREKRQDRKLYIALMVGGFIWSQLQTEYLIWRVRRDTKNIVD